MTPHEIRCKEALEGELLGTDIPALDLRELEGGVLEVQLLRDSEVSDLRAAIRSAQAWKSATVQSGSESRVEVSIRKADVLMATDEPALFVRFERLYQTRIQALARVLSNSKLESTRPQIVRYVPGNYYHVHRDNSGQYHQRLLSVVCYLNDDFTGGETYFPELCRGFRAPPGKALIFPSKLPHAGSNVETGEKLIMVQWLIRQDVPARGSAKGLPLRNSGKELPRR